MSKQADSPDTSRRAAGISQLSEATRHHVSQEINGGSDATNPEFLFQQTATPLLLAITGGLIDPVLLARCELANRGLDLDGKWVGFAAAEKLHLGESES